VAIIGAGICGLYLGKKLAEAGNEVTLFEKKSVIGKEVCSGLFSERILNLIPESKSLIQNQIDYCLIHFPSPEKRGSERRDETKFQRPPGRILKIRFARKFFVMSHSRLDNLAADLAGKAGAKIILNTAVSSLPTGYDYIIGCDGANSFVRKKLGLAEPNYRLAIQGFISKKDFSSFVETWPTKSGFIWKIPRGEETEYGIFEKPETAKKIFEKFLKENNLSLEKMGSALIPQGLIIPKSRSITLCGDSAGLTKPWSGGGVIWGLLAANILLKNFPDFVKYQQEAKRLFLPKIVFSKVAKKMAYFLGFNFPWILPKNIKIEGDFLI